MVPNFCAALGVCLVSALAAPAIAFAQSVAHITLVEGAVTISRAYSAAPARLGVALIDRDQLQTGPGRVEITFHDGSVLHVDRDSDVVVFARDRFRISGGRALFRSSTLTPAGYEVESDAARFRVMPHGVFGILVDANNRQTLLSVISGDARIESSWGNTAVTARQMAMVSGPTGHPFVTPYFPERIDDFDVWSTMRALSLRGSPANPVTADGGFYEPGTASDPPATATIDTTGTAYWSTPYWGYGGGYYWGGGWWRGDHVDHRDRGDGRHFGDGNRGDRRDNDGRRDSFDRGDRDNRGDRGDRGDRGNRGGDRGRGDGGRGTSAPATRPSGPSSSSPPSPRGAGAGAPARPPR